MAAFLVVRYGVQIGFTLPLADFESDATEHLALSLDQALCTASEVLYKVEEFDANLKGSLAWSLPSKSPARPT